MDTAMFGKLIESFKAYCERNEKSYEQSEQKWANCGQVNSSSTPQYSIVPLPDNLKYKLEEDVVGGLYTLILLNDDITTMEYIIQVLEVCLGKGHYQAVELMLKVHKSGSAQVIAGNKTTLEEVAKHIETDARGKKFPTKFSIEKI
jgi:ATP-dependent Clp protease adaptor protein ClpS